MRGFDAKSKIAEDIEQLRGRFGYDYLELQCVGIRSPCTRALCADANPAAISGRRFEFAIDLFPCFPPQLKIVRPRLAASMLQRVSALEFFKLSYWNPANDMRTVIQQVLPCALDHFGELQLTWFVDRFGRPLKSGADWSRCMK